MYCSVFTMETNSRIKRITKIKNNKKNYLSAFFHPSKRIHFETPYVSDKLKATKALPSLNLYIL